MWNPDHGGMFGNDEEVGRGHEGALMHLLDPNALLGLARLEATGETVTGRRWQSCAPFPDPRARSNSALRS
jgi:hypothetical protein